MGDERRKVSNLDRGYLTMKYVCSYICLLCTDLYSSVVREINKINERELDLGIKGSWHDDYKGAHALPSMAAYRLLLITQTLPISSSGD